MHALILGTRGVPAQHGGFETFAEQLARYLVQRNHQVTVYCQAGAQEAASEDSWEGIRRVSIPAGEGAAGTIKFDWDAIRHSSRERGVILTLGYNTGVLNLLHRLRGIPNVMNMDGIEWKREKWSKPQQAWLWANEWAGARVANHLVADHPEIKKHLSRHTPAEKITTIPYGSDAVTSAPIDPILPFGLKPKEYYILIARPEPENSVLEIVQAYAARKRGIPLVVLGTYRPEVNLYHKQVLGSGSEEVRFVGAIYDQSIVRSLRFYAKGYFHGHRVGGTNPSLVESLAAGNAVIAHDNVFTRWVAGPGTKFFKRPEDVIAILDLLEREPGVLKQMEEASRKRHLESFTQEQILSAYEQLLARFAPSK